MTHQEMDSHAGLDIGSEETPIRVVFKKFGIQKDVSLIYGEPVEVGLNKVVPVAKLKYAIGGGGEGAGGSFSVKPVGVYEITPERVTFKPANNYRKLAAVGIIVAGIAGVLFTRKS